MNIPYHANNTELVQTISDKLVDFNGEAEIILNNDNEGYSGEYEIDISTDNKFFDVTNYVNADITRFPARIRGAATSLRNLNILGHFKIAHKSGTLNIKRLFRNLNLNELYSREQIHSIFSPDTTFTKGSGSWGNHGIVSIPNRENDFVFIVTYGQTVGSHTFDEGITSEGVLSWQSQPSNKLVDARIQKLINHNEINDNIYLFLREDEGLDYKYLGRLKYLSHDYEREKPVYFQWQLLDWPTKKTHKNDEASSKKPNFIPGKIKLSKDNPVKKNVGTTLEEFRTKKSPDYALKEKNNKKLGDLGEELVLKYEKEKLMSLNRKDLAEKVLHVSKIEGDGAGYDIKSYDINGSIMYIEVKATRGNINTDFFMSPIEIKFFKKNKNNFFFYLVFDINKENDGKFYIVQGDITETFNTEPTNFKLSKK